MTASNTHDLEKVLEALEEEACDANNELSVGRTLDAFASRSFGALLTMVALVAALPVIGAIPGVSILTGSLIILISVQFLIGRDTPWIPGKLRDLSINPESMRSAISKTKPYASYVDAIIKPRLTFLTDGPVARSVIALLTIFLAVIFYPMALIPGGVWLPSISVMALGLALLGQDGLLALFGGAGAIGSLLMIAWLL